jgi:succinyl-CoA synthetase beta subunit
MNIHEYQAKKLLQSYGAPVSDGRIVLRSEDAKTAAGELDGPLWVVKAQIHAGGRGKGTFKEPKAGEKGGVRMARSVTEAAEEAKKNAWAHAGNTSNRPQRQAGKPRLH